MTMEVVTGGAAVPGAYTLGPQNPDSLVKPNGDVIAAMTIQATETNYGVWFKFTVPLTVYNTVPAAGPLAPPAARGPSAALRALVLDRASLIYNLGQIAEVTDIRYIELTNKQGLFKDNLLVEVSTPDLESSSDVIVPFNPLNYASVENPIAAAYAQLLANLTPP